MDEPFQDYGYFKNKKIQIDKENETHKNIHKQCSE